MVNIIDRIKKQNIVLLIEIKNSDCAKIEYVDKCISDYDECYKNFIAYKDLNKNIRINRIYNRKYKLYY